MTKEEIQEILDRNPIEDTIRGHVQLVPDGINYRADCPFCLERDAFHVSPGKKVYHCFNCHRGGDVFRFLREMKGLSFLEAVNLLDHRVGGE